MVGRLKVSIGLTTVIGWAVALSGCVPIVSKAVQEGHGIAVHGPEGLLLAIGIGVGGLVQIGRFLQAAAGVSVKVKAGITTAVGYLVGLGGLIPILIKSYSEGTQALHSPEKYMAIAGVVFLGVTTVGRYLQTLPFFAASREALGSAAPVGARPGMG